MITQTRREKLREATIQEIKQVALSQMAEQGAAALSLRAIASQMSMSAPALYNYFDSRDALLTALILDAYTSLGDATHAASEAKAGASYGAQFVAVCLALRNWALAHREQYMLIFGSPIPGYHAPAAITTPASVRSTLPFVQTLEAAQQAGQITIPGEYAGLSASPAHQQIEAVFQSQGFNLSAAILQAAMAGWGQIIGLISLELYGHFDYLNTDMGEVYQAEVTAYVKRLGLSI